MKRIIGEVKEGQSVEEKRSRTKEESSKPSGFNPFLVEPILRKLLKKVDTVAELKDLRKMCALWDKLGVEELEDRAFEDKLESIDFEWTDRFETKEEAEKELVEFLEDTREIPRLFRSFAFNIPESLKVLQAHPDFFSDYTVDGVELFMPNEMNFKELQIPMEYFLNLIGENLKEIQMPYYLYESSSFNPKSSNWPKPGRKLLLPKLEKLSIHIEESDWCEFFKSALVKGNGHLTSLELASLPGADIGSFPGLDPTRMTHLDVRSFEKIGGSGQALKFITGLITLVDQGMRLVNFGLHINSISRTINPPESAFDRDTLDTFSQNLPPICSNLTHFFETQSPTLATINLQLDFFANSRDCSDDELRAKVAAFGKIKLPIFPVLHTVSFVHDLRIQNQNQIPFQNTIYYGLSLSESLFDIPHSSHIHFPSLVNLSFDSTCSLPIFCDYPPPELPEASKFHFKRLDLPMMEFRIDYESWATGYNALIGSVEYFRVRASILEAVRIPWIDSLRKLRTEYVSAPLKLAHLKNLEKLIIKDYRWIGYEKIKARPPGPGRPEVQRQESISEFLSWFSEATQLNLTSIKFIGLKLMGEGIREEFNRYFPYPVQFEDN